MYDAFSHPDKKYENHIENVSKSFNDEKHFECANYHDFAKKSDNFQKYITLKRENFADIKDFEKARNKLKTTHSLESAYIYFFTQSKKDIDFIINLIVILKHHSNLENFFDMIDLLKVIKSRKFIWYY